jgi:endogenous inhibitor of DNA gyrase (YacG/DUF329 family)
MTDKPLLQPVLSPTATYPDRLIIEWNGTRYYSYPSSKLWSDRYFKYQGKLLHRELWRFYKGEIPSGHEIHHKDKNPANNDLDNLESIHKGDHIATYHKNLSLRQLIHITKSYRKFQRKAKDWHRSGVGREWHRQHIKQQMETLQPTERTCDNCGKSYQVLWDRKVNRFCSNRCKTAARYTSGVDNVEYTCVVCGKVFVRNRYARGTHQFCSRQCSAISRRKGSMSDEKAPEI